MLTPIHFERYFNRSNYFSCRSALRIPLKPLCSASQASFYRITFVTLYNSPISIRYIVRVYETMSSSWRTEFHTEKSKYLEQISHIEKGITILSELALHLLIKFSINVILVAIELVSLIWHVISCWKQLAGNPNFFVCFM